MSSRDCAITAVLLLVFLCMGSAHGHRFFLETREGNVALSPAPIQPIHLLKYEPTSGLLEKSPGGPMDMDLQESEFFEMPALEQLVSLPLGEEQSNEPWDSDHPAEKERQDGEPWLAASQMKYGAASTMADWVELGESPMRDSTFSPSEGISEIEEYEPAPPDMANSRI